MPQGAVIADAQGVGTILDDDPSVELEATGVEVEEGDDGTVGAVFTLTLSGPSNRVVRIDYMTADGTATGGMEGDPGADYLPKTGYLEFPIGTTEATVTVEVYGDLDPEDDETFILQLSNVYGADLLTPMPEGTILDDDVRELYIDDVSVEEGDDGTVEAVFTVGLEPRPSDIDVAVDYVTAARHGRRRHRLRDDQRHGEHPGW